MACGAASLPCKRKRIIAHQSVRMRVQRPRRGRGGRGRALELGELLQQRLHLLQAIHVHIPVLLLLLWLVVGATPALV